jgi:MoaA/NifB/PqqE/SkfB family radical SAM enzyme
VFELRQVGRAPASAARARLVVVWRVTERCNLACPFCRYDRRQAFPRRGADAAMVLAGGAALAAHRDATGQPVLVSWLGGEPYAWPPLVAMSRHFRHRLGLAVGVTTNGTALARADVRRHAVDDLDELTVSVDGLEERHDRLRGWPGGFAKLRDGIGWIAGEAGRRGSGPLLRANVVLMRDNAHELLALCRELARWGIAEVTFNALGGNDRPEFHAGHHLLPAQVAWLGARLPEWQAELAALGLRLRGGADYLQRIAATTVGRRLPVASCRPGESFLFVDEKGVASPCHFTTSAYGRPLAVALADGFGGLPRAPACDDCQSTQVFGKFAAAPAAPAGGERRLVTIAGRKPPAGRESATA